MSTYQFQSQLRYICISEIRRYGYKSYGTAAMRTILNGSTSTETTTCLCKSGERPRISCSRISIQKLIKNIQRREKSKNIFIELNWLQCVGCLAYKGFQRAEKQQGGREKSGEHFNCGAYEIIKAIWWLILELVVMEAYQRLRIIGLERNLVFFFFTEP